MSKLLHQRLVFSIISLLTIVFTIAAVPGATNYQNDGWSTPITISSLQVTGWFPDIVSDSMNQIHVAWAGGTTGFDTVLYTSSSDGVNWTKINDIAAVPRNGTDSVATRPALWVDNQGYLNISYVGGSLFFSRAPVDLSSSATAWSEPLKVNSNQVAYFSRLVQDSKNQLHLFYTENVVSDNCAQCYHLYHKVSTDHGATWSDAQDISADGTGAAKPQVIINTKGDIFVVWESGTGGGLGQLSGPSAVKFSASYDYGETWTPSEKLSPSSVQQAKDVTIGLDKYGKLVTAWLAIPDNTVNYQTSSDDGKTWSDPTPIIGISGNWDIYPSKLDDYSMAMDSSGNIHLVLVGEITDTSSTSTPTPTETPQRSSLTPTPTPTPSSLYVLHLTWQGFSWSRPEVVTKFTGDVPEWPRAAISGGNVLNVVWFVRDYANIWNSDNAHYRIWYTRKMLSSPVIPTTVPTYPSTSEPVATLQISPTNTNPAANSSLPTLSPSEKIKTQPVYTESDYISVFAKSMIPTALMILVVGLIVFFLRNRQ